ncbi:MAG: hypothetical protein RIS94_338 [Pseudomonadota bacterium]|jgi:diguanylate cyclase (GGDEF)-like protein
MRGRPPTLAFGVIGAVLMVIAAIQATHLLWDYAHADKDIAAAAARRADTALRMLQALHTQTMAHRVEADDNDPVVQTFDATMARYSHDGSDVALWMVMGPKVAAWQLASHNRTIETPRDAVDRQVLARAREVQSYDHDVLRLSRPVVLGQGAAADARCMSCHGGRMGLRPGDVIGAYSARTTTGAERAAWWQSYRDQAWLVGGLAVMGALALSLYLRRALLLPLAHLAGETERMARGLIEDPVDTGGRRDEIGRIGGALEDFRNTLVQKRALSDYNAYLASHDHLTGLPNRTAFARTLKEGLRLATAGHGKLACAVIDLDRFKHVNDRYGHEVGDALLRSVGRTLRETLLPGETVARLGGDEFAACRVCDTDEDLARFVARLEAAVSVPFTWNAITLTASASIGFAVCPDDGLRIEQLLNNADLAMYRAKAEPHCLSARYDRDMDERARHRSALAADLSHAVERGEIVVHYQAQNDTRSGRVIGYEALARWIHPDRGLISPGEFIPLAEETGAIVAIGEFVLREACRLAAANREGICVAVNVSAVQLNEGDFSHIVHQALVETGLSPARLELELTETALVTNRDRALHILRRLKALGVQIAIDDFGVGYSSLETISLFPIDKIKVDRSFVSAFEADPKSRSLLKAIMTIGESLQVPILAEGVETPSQLAFLRSVGCAQVQGYLFDQPRLRHRLAFDIPEDPAARVGAA